MSEATLHGHEHGHEEHLWHQFEDRQQQDECYVVGMWSFLVTEIMFFGALLLAYAIYRFIYPDIFFTVHEELNIKMGFINTLILLTSSLTMALAVRCSQLGDRKGFQRNLGITILCAFGFLVVKYFEYSAKFEHHLVPGINYQDMWPQFGGKSELFFGLYFCLTGLHGIHVLIGIAVLGAFFIMSKLKHPSADYYIYVEMAGLYWHFVDIVWIFLYPLLYLIGSK